MPVHLGGAAADLDTIMDRARRRNVTVVEDACQAHLAEWRGRKVGTYGRTGCFSFQASKNLNSGEGGAILTDDETLIETCYRFHNNGRGRRNTGDDFSYRNSGANLRMTEFQGALLTAQMTRLEAQARTRDENAAYLTEPAAADPRNHAGAHVRRMHAQRVSPLHVPLRGRRGSPGCRRRRSSRRWRQRAFPRQGGYSPLNKEPFLEAVLSSPRLTGRSIHGRGSRTGARGTSCPQNDRLCTEAVWLVQTMLLGSRKDMDDIATAVGKVQAHAAQLAKRTAPV